VLIFKGKHTVLAGVSMSVTQGGHSGIDPDSAKGIPGGGTAGFLVTQRVDRTAVTVFDQNRLFRDQPHHVSAVGGWTVAAGSALQ